MNRKTHIIKNCFQPMRLDRYLRLEYGNMPQSLIEKTLRKGLIRLNSKKAASNDRVKNDDILELRINLQPNIEEEKKIPYGAKGLSEKLFSEYLVADEKEFIVINKPSGLSSQSGSNVLLAIDDALNFLNKENDMQDKVNDGFRLVHRLDKDTSGVFLIAKDRPAAIKLTEGFKEKIILKQYLAIVVGKPKKLEGKITSFLVKDGYLKIQKTSAKGDFAETEYKVLASSDEFSLILFTPKTGRMHQLRVHAKELGCPIVGDGKYGAASKKQKLLLHSYTLKIPKIIFDKNYEFKASLPEYFFSFLSENLSSETSKVLSKL